MPKRPSKKAMESMGGAVANPLWAAERQGPDAFDEIEDIEEVEEEDASSPTRVSQHRTHGSECRCSSLFEPPVFFRIVAFSCCLVFDIGRKRSRTSLL